MRKNKICCSICEKHICREECMPIYLRKKHGYIKLATLCYQCYITMLDYLGIGEK